MAIKRWAIRDAGIATFYNITTGDPIVTLPSLKTTGVETTGETVYARGGRGNAKLVGFSSNREATLTLEDALFDNDALAMLTGNDIVSGEEEVEFSEVITADATDVTESSLTVTKGTPLSDGTLAVYAYVDGMKDGDNLAGETVTGSEIDLTEPPTEGTTYIVYYTVKTNPNASKVKVTSDEFGGTFKVVIDLLVTDSITKENYAGQLIIANAKFEDNFSLDLSVDGDPAVLNLSLEVLKDPDSTDMWELVIFDADGVA